MTEKIFDCLKTMYASLGLGDTILKPYAESLNKTGLVNDGNLEQICGMQETALKAMQSGLDKRANEAVDTAIKKAKAEAEKAKAELLKEQEEAINKAKAEAEKAIKELEDLKKAKADNPPAPPAKTDDEPKTKENSIDVEALKAALMAQFTEQMGNQLAELKTASDKAQKTLADKIAALTAENEQFKADKAKADAEAKAQARAKFITDTATSLGIPEWRQKEGFVIAPEADDSAITATLTTISENLRANALPASGIKGASAQNPVKLDNDKLSSLAASIVSKSMH